MIEAAVLIVGLLVIDYRLNKVCKILNAAVKSLHAIEDNQRKVAKRNQ